MSDQPVDIVRQVAADVFGVSADGISETDSSDTIPEWDSMKHLMLVMALEERFDVAFSPEEIERIRTIADAVAMIGSKKESP